MLRIDVDQKGVVSAKFGGPRRGREGPPNPRFRRAAATRLSSIPEGRRRSRETSLHDCRPRGRAEADRARAILLTLDGWRSARIGEAFGVREDVIRDWSSTFMRVGVEGLVSRDPSGRPPVKAQAADQIGRCRDYLTAEIERRTGVTISKSRLSAVLQRGLSYRRLAISG